MPTQRMYQNIVTIHIQFVTGWCKNP